MLTATATYEQELSVPADTSQLERVRHFVGAVAAHCGYDRQSRFDIVAAVHEAVANAMTHGSRSSRDTVSVRALCRNGSLVFYVRDRGRPRGSTSVIDAFGEGEFAPAMGTAIMRSLTRELYVVPSAGGTTVRLSI